MTSQKLRSSDLVNTLFGPTDKYVETINPYISIVKKIPSNKLVFLTDTNSWQTEKEQEWVNLKQYAFKVFRSHKIGMLKTDKELFPYIIKELGFEANKILLIDDSPEKIKMAQQYSIQTYRYKNPVLLKRFLSNLDN